MLCRGIVRLFFGGKGRFKALSNQPGVEFHLQLDRECGALGKPGRRWGWQCKFFNIPSGSSLGPARRRQIQESLEMTAKHLPDLTDWVLWTRYPLTSGDQEWYEGLQTNIILHLWTEQELENYLSGPATYLRSTYFGELILLPSDLQNWHHQSVAPIQSRWQPEVHQIREVELAARRMLGEAVAWDNLPAIAASMRSNSSAAMSCNEVPAHLQSLVDTLEATTARIADEMDYVFKSIGDGDFGVLRDVLSNGPPKLPVEVVTAPRKLRAANHAAGLHATNAVADCHDASRALQIAVSAFSSQLVAIVSPAGCGKTHLAAQLTNRSTVRPHGVLLHGRDLRANQNLNDLAGGLNISGRPLPSMEALLQAVDAAGQRARKRLPLVIDGLNEAEDPRKWSSLLAALLQLLPNYPYVLVVCTLRPDFEAQALPAGTPILAMVGYDRETEEAIAIHCEHWKIEVPDARWWGLLTHPLTLRIFCEVTNPGGEHHVGAHAVPASLSLLFERYLEQICRKVSDNAHLSCLYHEEDVRSAISLIAKELWETRSRSIDMQRLRILLGDEKRTWHNSIVRAFQQEGLLSRMASNDGDTFSPVYDLLGGHISATHLLHIHDQSSLETWISKSEMILSLAGGFEERHPFADDILVSLVSQIPCRFPGKQVWMIVQEPLREKALRLAANLPASDLDHETVEALHNLARCGDEGILEEFFRLRAASEHPLNADGLDRVLRPMAVGERDLRWTDWLRTHNDRWINGLRISKDIERLEAIWQSGVIQSVDSLNARWVMWTLTSTERRMRDQATYALYRYGRATPKGLFKLVVDALGINDPYVGERMLAAAYGVVTTFQTSVDECREHIEPFLKDLATALVGTSASAPIHHYLSRTYVRGIVEFAKTFCPDALPAELTGDWRFASPPSVKPLVKGDEGEDEAHSTLNLDFENYTIGGLFPDRQNYFMNHEGFQAAVAHVLGTVRALGWREESFGDLDRRISDSGFLNRGRETQTERYGKKYGWAGFFSYVGILEDRGELAIASYGFSDVDIDPSFPKKPRHDGENTMSQVWLSPSQTSDEVWLRDGATPLPRELLRRPSIGGVDGPWILLHASLETEDKVLGRTSWAMITACVTAKEDAAAVASALAERGLDHFYVPDDHYTYAGEVPWHSKFAAATLHEDGYLRTIKGKTSQFDIEILAHGYEWERYHSELNDAGGALVPSKPLSQTFHLRTAAQSFDQFHPDGSHATISLGGVDGLEGQALYIREDLLLKYAENRALLWSTFGERQLCSLSLIRPEWLTRILELRLNSWHKVFTLQDL